MKTHELLQRARLAAGSKRCLSLAGLERWLLVFEADGLLLRSGDDWRPTLRGQRDLSLVRQAFPPDVPIAAVLAVTVPDLAGDEALAA